MLIPRYWARAEGTASPPGRKKPYRLRSWGCSPLSTEQAQADAKARLESWIRRLEAGQEPGGHYAYGRSVLREALLHELPGPGDEPLAIVTRNRYGCLVLNAAQTLFLDVDLPPDTLLGRVWSLLRGRTASLEQQVLARVRAALAGARDASFRLYRTAAGFRVIGTDRPWGPADPATVSLMTQAGTDRAFVTLCRVQDCFRARLSPKPWRIGQPTPVIDFPFPTPQAEASATEWQARYETAASGYATCRFLEAYGPGDVHVEVEPVLTFHDVATRADSGLPLA
ncbi:MAG TPA: hypothetical protein VNH46_08100 [Gemmatimonadales bacterium]|nr:hypothetical protein [Gemmatimonadales bacterium]